MPQKKKLQLKDPKVNAFLSAFEALFCESRDDEEDYADSAENDENEEQEETNEDTGELQGFLAMIGSSKRLSSGIIGAHTSLIFRQIKFLLTNP